MSRGRDHESGGEGLSRWSRLKAEARTNEARKAVQPARPLKEQAPPAPDYEAMSDDEALAALGLPEPETLRRGGEAARAFMASHVPQRLRRRALRALWRSDPVFAVLDGLNDYDTDFTNAGGGIVQTAYQVGRGFARADDAADRPTSDRADGPDDDAAESEDRPDGADEPSQETTAAETETSALPDQAGSEDGDHTGEERAAEPVADRSSGKGRPRRMMFRV